MPMSLMTAILLTIICVSGAISALQHQSVAGFIGCAVGIAFTLTQVLELAMKDTP